MNLLNFCSQLSSFCLKNFCIQRILRMRFCGCYSVLSNVFLFPAVVCANAFIFFFAYIYIYICICINFGIDFILSECKYNLSFIGMSGWDVSFWSYNKYKYWNSGNSKYNFKVTKAAGQIQNVEVYETISVLFITSC